MRRITLREALREAMIEEMRRDDRVFLMGEEVAEYDGAYKLSKGMLEEFGARRVIDTPIAELGFASIGVGAAMNGLIPMVEFMTWNFAVLAFDQIVNNAAKTLAQSAGQFSCPVIFRGPSGFGGQLAQQHSQTFESWMGNVPGLKVISTVDPYDAKALLKASLRDGNPICFFESEIIYNFPLGNGSMGKDKFGNVKPLPYEAFGLVPENEDIIEPIGKAAIRREGTDVTLVSFNKMVIDCCYAAMELEKQGISAEVIDLRTIRPLDIATVVKSVRKTNRIVVVDESWPMFGVSAEVAYQVQKYAFDHLDAPVVRVNGADVSMPYAETLVDAYMPSPEKIVKAVKEVMYSRV
jgi:pyruvate dehydrogenase E1 component beta subunit